jgi:hypothetical protein
VTLPPCAQPSTLSVLSQRSLASELSGIPSLAPSSAASWSLWSQGGSGGPSFYEQLQAAASDSFALGTAPAGSASIASHAALHASGLASPAASAAPRQYLHLAPGPAAPTAAPFPGLVGHGLGLAVGYMLSAPVHASRPSLDAEFEMQQLLAAIASMATQDG